MKKILLLLLITLLATAAYAVTEGNQKGSLIQIIDEQLREVIRLNKQTRGRNPDLILQLAELELEKARVLKEVETDKYLAIPAKKRSRVNKASMFKRSTSYFNEARRQCVRLLKRYPNYRGKADAYYILAYHARDIEKNKAKATKYFTAARKTSRSGTVVYNKSTMALAEMYYNQKQYKKAIPLYKSALKGKKNRWWTKDAHSLAWSYFRVGKKKLAVSTMEGVLARSKNKNFINMAKSAERDLAYFYSATGKIAKAIKLSSKVSGNSVDYLIKIGIHTKEQGHYKNASRVLEKALSKGPNRYQQAKIYASLLDIYDRLGFYGSQLRNAQKINSLRKNGGISKEFSENLKYYAQKSAAILQRVVMGKTYLHNKKSRLNKANQAVGFFEVLKEINPKTAPRAELLIAETYYATGRFNSAIPHYDVALQLAQKNGDAKVEKEALAGLSTSLEKKSVKKSLKKKYLVRTYLAFLKKNRRGPEAFKVYQRLFNIYFEAKNIKGAESALLAFKRNFPKKVGIQEAMLGKILDFHKSNKNIAEMKGWLNRINKREFIVNRRFKKQLRALITTMRFETVEKANTKGDKVNALKGYIALYSDPSSTNYEKKNAAYNIAILFQMLGNADMTYKFTKRALSHMNGKDVKKFEKTFITIASYFFNKRQFDKAIDVNLSVYNKLCKETSHNKEVFYRNVYVLNIAEGRTSGLPAFVDGGYSCKISSRIINNARLEVADEFAKNKSWSELSSMINKLEKKKSNAPELIALRYSLYQAYSDSGRHKLAVRQKKKLLKDFSYGESKRLSISLEARDIVANFKIKNLYKELRKLSAIKLRFPEKTYNKLLQKKFKMLDSVTNKALATLNVKSGKGIVRAYKYLVETYTEVAKEIRGFTPPGKEKAYVDGFQKAMGNITKPLDLQAKKFRNDAVRAIKESTILSKDNAFFTAKTLIPVKVEYQYHLGGVVMDRGGRR